MNEIQLSELLDRYLNDTCSPEEREVIDNWLEFYKDKPDFTGNLTEEKKERLKAKIFSGVSAEIGIGPESRKAGLIRPLFKSWWVRGISAAVLLLLFRFMLIDKPFLPNGTVAGSSGILFTNHTKNIVKRVLPDHSVVWLYPDASLTYPKMFRKESRNISMKGDCFFEITKNPRRPFIISCDHIVTKVWGTSFSVLDDARHPAAIVTVVTGKVSVSKREGKAVAAGIKLTADEVMLMPNEQMVYDKRKHAITTRRQADLSALRMYRHVNLSFENARLTGIVQVLNDNYGVQIKIQDETLSRAMMTADLTDLNLPEILEVLKTSMKLNYEITHDLIILKKTN